MEVPLRESAVVKLNASGNGTASIGPISARERWSPDNVHVSVSSNTNEASCLIYVGDAAIQQNFRDGTFSGSSGDSTDKINADKVSVGQKIWAVWSGGDGGATASLSVTGTKQL